MDIVLAGDGQSMVAEPLLIDFVGQLDEQGSRIVVQSMGLVVCPRDLADRRDKPVNRCRSYQSVTDHSWVHDSVIS